MSNNLSVPSVPSVSAPSVPSVPSVRPSASLKLSRDTASLLSVGDGLIMGRYSYIVRTILNYTAWNKRCTSVTITDEKTGQTIYTYPVSKLYGVLIDKRVPEVFYTGGGIWCASMYFAPHMYYGISSEDEGIGDSLEGFLSVFDDREDEEPGGICFQGYKGCVMESDFTEQERKAYNRMEAALLKAMEESF